MEQWLYNFLMGNSALWSGYFTTKAIYNYLSKRLSKNKIPPEPKIKVAAKAGDMSSEVKDENKRTPTYDTIPAIITRRFNNLLTSVTRVSSELLGLKSLAVQKRGGVSG